MVSEKLLRYHPEVVALFKEMAEGNVNLDLYLYRFDFKEIFLKNFRIFKINSNFRIYSVSYGLHFNTFYCI